jgi:hypothetical protein
MGSELKRARADRQPAKEKEEARTMKALKRWLPTILVTIGLLGLFHATMGLPVGCHYEHGYWNPAPSKSVVIWPWEPCNVSEVVPGIPTQTDPYADLFTTRTVVYDDPYAKVWQPILPPLSPRQSEVLILLGVVLLALRKLPDRAGTVA